MSGNETSNAATSNLLDRLHHPMQLRMFVTAIVLTVGYAAVFMPLDSSISETTRALEKEEKRLSSARDIEYLRNQQKQFQDRMPKDGDRNEWVEYVLSGVRTLPLKLVVLEAKPSVEVGPFKAVALHCELEGAFHDMEKLIRWIEFNDRMFRIDSVKIAPHRSNNGTLVLQMDLLGMMG